MNRIQKVLFSISIIAVLVIGIAFIASAALKPNQNTPVKNLFPAEASQVKLSDDFTVAAWIWEYPTSLHGNMEETLSFAASEDINTLYLYIDEYVDIYEMPEGPERERKMNEYTDAVKNIIALSKEKGMSVHALSGNVNYSYDSHDYIPPLLIEHVFQFNSENPETQFDGIQFDIEFYEDERFFGSTQEYTDYYLDLVDRIAVQTAELNDEYDHDLRLGFVIPFWFDRPNEYFSEPILPSILDSLSTLPNSYIVIMAYRNIVEGDDSVMEVSTDELKAAEGTGVKVIIAQEIVENREKKITHFGKSRSEIKTDFAKIIDLSRKYSSFEGISIHELLAFKDTR